MATVPYNPVTSLPSNRSPEFYLSVMSDAHTRMNDAIKNKMRGSYAYWHCVYYTANRYYKLKTEEMKPCPCLIL